MGSYNSTNKPARDGPLLMIPGPIEFHEDVLQAMGEQTPSHVAPSFIAEFSNCLKNVRNVLLAKAAQPFVIAGSGSLGWDFICANLVEPGDDVLVPNTGYFSDSFASCIRAYGGEPHEIKFEVGRCVDVKQVEAALGQKKFKMIALTQVDTSTGVLNDIGAIAEAVRRVQPDCLIAVDGVCSFGGEEFRFDEWKLDACMTASQKAFGVPPGLMVMALSERALQVHANRSAPVSSYYSNVANWLPIMRNYEEKKGCYFATPAVNLIRALNVSLQQLVDIGIEEVFRRHAAQSDAFKAAVAALGLKLLPKDGEVPAHTLSAILYPASDEEKKADHTKIVANMKVNGVVCAGGLHRVVKATYFRIGHMGLSVLDKSRGHIPKVVQALEDSLIASGFSVEAGTAIKAYETALVEAEAKPTNTVKSDPASSSKL